jgi:hypothetical protein
MFRHQETNNSLDCYIPHPPAWPLEQAASRLPQGRHAAFGLFLTLARIWRAVPFRQDSPGNHFGKYLPKSMHMRWKGLGIRRIDVASLRPAVIVGALFGLLRFGSGHCWCTCFRKLAACPGATSAPVGTPPVVFAAVATKPPCDGFACRSAAVHGDEAESHRRPPSRCHTSRDREHLAGIASPPASAHSRPNDRRCGTHDYRRGDRLAQGSHDGGEETVVIMKRHLRNPPRSGIKRNTGDERRRR